MCYVRQEAENAQNNLFYICKRGDITPAYQIINATDILIKILSSISISSGKW